MRVLTLGTFDLFHRGHVNLLIRCKGLAGDGEVIVALNPDEFVADFKGHAPVVNYDDRRAVLEACKYVDRVVRGSGADSRPIIAEVAPDIIAVGSDWQGRDYHAQLQVTPGWLEEHDITIVYLPYTEDISSTRIRERMAA